MFTGTAVLPAYLHNPVFPDGVSEGSPHKLPLVLICILSPQTGSVRLICCIAPTQSRLSFSIGRPAHLAKDQFWGNEPVVQKTCPMLNLLCWYVLALNISKPFLFTTIEYTDILHPFVTSIWISVAEVARWRKGSSLKSSDTLLCHDIRFVAIYALFGRLCAKK